MSTGIYKGRFRQYLYEEQKGKCYWCNRRMTYNRNSSGQPGRSFATFEHLKRKQDGGLTNSVNIVLAHKKCNNIRQSEEGKKRPKGIRPHDWITILEKWKQYAEACRSQADRAVLLKQ